MQYFTIEFIDFFKKLAANNNKNWFDAHKSEYEAFVKLPFHQFIQDLLIECSKYQPEIEKEAKHAIFRIYRDVRFSKDKTPYKLYASALLSAKGRNDITHPGLYLELGPEFISIFGGIYAPDTKQIYQMRKHIVKNSNQLIAIQNDRDFIEKFGEIKGDKQVRINSEFKKNISEQPLILNKQWIIEAQLPANALLENDILHLLLDYLKTALPLNLFITEALQNQI